MYHLHRRVEIIVKRAVFYDRLIRLNNKIKLIILETKVKFLVDNASSHNVENRKLSNVTLHYLPPNMKCVLQPNDAGIIKAFKAHYKRLFGGMFYY